MKKQSAKSELVEALVEIRDSALQHPYCNRELFDSRSIDEIIAIGGEVCDWTMIAITADDALKSVGKGIADDNNT